MGDGTRITWHDVVIECERIFGCKDTATYPARSNLPNLIRDLQSEKGSVRDALNVALADIKHLEFLLANLYRGIHDRDCEEDRK